MVRNKSELVLLSLMMMQQEVCHFKIIPKDENGTYLRAVNFAFRLG
jgi:hypothetical protein